MPFESREGGCRLVRSPTGFMRSDRFIVARPKGVMGKAVLLTLWGNHKVLHDLEVGIAM